LTDCKSAATNINRVVYIVKRTNFPLIWKQSSSVLFLVLGLVLAQPAQADDFGTIESIFYTKKWDNKTNCLEASSRDAIPNFEDCDSDRLAQLWFATRANTGLVVFHETVRSAAYPDRCLTAIYDPQKKLDVLSLKPCRSQAKQRWAPKGNDLLENDGKCAQASGDRLYIRGCGHNDDRQALDVRNVNRVTNNSIGKFIRDHVDVPEGHRFQDYKDCYDKDQDGCFINLGDGQQYGYNFGTELGGDDTGWGDGTQSGGKLMDLGDQYSADRCALAHDRHYWYREGNSKSPHPNDMHFWLCLKKIIPTTAQENTALAAGELAYGLINYGAFVEGEFQQLDSCTGDKKGTLPRAGSPIDSCWCRAFSPELDAKLTAANVTAGLPPSQAALDALDVALEKIDDGDPLMQIKDAKNPNDSSLKCSGITTNSFIRRYKALNVKRSDLADSLKPMPRTMVQGDILWLIAIDEGVNNIPAYIAAFAAINPDTDPDLIFAGQEYQLPSFQAY
jgi:hypothetical protein